MLQNLKSAYRLTEAPRLRYLRAVELMKATGGIELKVSRTTFQIVDPAVAANLPVGCCHLHVDDSHIFGDMRNPVYLEALEQINQ
eukprot:796134-Heterocapsa_arctica.AAC.1